MRMSAACSAAGERQHADEQAHGEADAAQHARRRRVAVQVAPSGMRRAPAWIASARRRRYADRLAEEQAERRCRAEPARQAWPAACRRARRRRWRSANSGRTPKATQGCRLLLERAAAAPVSPSRGASGMAKANATPASVACTPDFSTQTQMKQSRAADRAPARVTPRRLSMHSAAMPAPASASERQRQVRRCRTRR